MEKFMEKQAITYDTNGSWSSYTYIRNPQGDILSIKDNSSTAIVKWIERLLKYDRGH